MTAHTDPELMRQMADHPDTPIEAILTAKGAIDALLAQLPPDFHIEHTYTLTSSVCVLARPATLRQLSELSAVKSIEPVRSVRHW